ncbi:MAG: hypothetical protein R2798_04495 [Chitinophagales bacterium]|nr:hypothetical protein [Bacteroidota bacterium]MCB9044310.1 hypothetical protein [Chitinophagales bacterium]
MSQHTLQSVKDIINKIEYLYKCLLEAPNNKTYSLQLLLFKQYTTELYDKIIELEIDNASTPIKSAPQNVPLYNNIVPATVPKVENKIVEKPIEVKKEEPIPVEIPKEEEKYVEVKTTNTILEDETLNGSHIVVSEEEEVDETDEQDTGNMRKAVENVTEKISDTAEKVEEKVSDWIDDGKEVAENLWAKTKKPFEVLEEKLQQSRENMSEKFAEADHDKTEVLTNLKGNMQESVKEIYSDVKSKTGELHEHLSQRKNTEPQLADKLASSVHENGFEIGYNDKVAYLNELFGGDEAVFNKSLEELSQSKNIIEAMTYVNLHLKMRYKWDSDSSTARNFMSMLRNKFA